MSWLARSIANSLRIDDDDDNDDDEQSQNDVVDDLRGVKDDLSEFGETLTRQLRGVAKFLAPPPNSHDHKHNCLFEFDSNRLEPSVSGDNDRLEIGRGVRIESEMDSKNVRNSSNLGLGYGRIRFIAPPSPHSTLTSANSHDQKQNHRFEFVSNQLEPSDPSVSGDDDQMEIRRGVRIESETDSTLKMFNSHDQKQNRGFESELNRMEPSDPSVPDDDDRISNQLEIGRGGRIRSETESKNVMNLSKLGLGYRKDDWIGRAVGLTDEVLAFAGNIACHPETWLDFPIEEEDDDLDDFRMSEAQKEHAMAVERLIPRLAALRIELCPAHMSKSYFWMIYFVLLQSRLNKHDAELLSSLQVVEARAKWMKELQKRAKEESERYRGTHYLKESADSLDEDSTPRSFNNEHSDAMSSWTFVSQVASSSTTADSEIDKQPLEEKPMVKTTETTPTLALPPSKVFLRKFDDDDDDDDEWPEDDYSGHGHSGRLIEGIDDVSFSDLEDDDCDPPMKFCRA